MKITPLIREYSTQTFQACLRFDGLPSEGQHTIVHIKSNHTPILNLKKHHFTGSIETTLSIPKYSFYSPQFKTPYVPKSLCF